MILFRTLILCFAIFALTSCTQSGDGRESFDDKREWSVLQVANSKSSASVLTAPEIKVVSGYDLLHVPGLDGKYNIWVMLRPESAPFYKQMPEGNYAISREFFDKLTDSGKLSSTTTDAIGSHVAK